MTVDELRVSNKEMLTAEDVCKIVGCDKYSIVLQAKNDPSRLGFPVVVVGTRVRIPRRAFLKFIGVEVNDK
jgi:hypothetical protein